MANIISAIKLPNGDKYNIKDEISNYAVQTGSYDDMIVGTAKMAEGFAGTEFKSDSTPYLHRPIDLDDFEVGDRSYNEEIVGGTVAWNQYVGEFNSVTMNGVTFTANGDGSVTASGTATGGMASISLSATTPAQLITNHVYYIHACPTGGSRNTYYGGIAGLSYDYGNGGIFKHNYEWSVSNVRLDVREGASINGTVYPQFIDLTKLFGSAEIADYVYSLEQTTSGSGVAWLKSHGFIDGSYRAYNEGSLVSVKTSEHRTVGFNQWDEEWEVGGYNSNGEKHNESTRIRSKNMMPVIPDTTYYLCCAKTLSSRWFGVSYYDANQGFISQAFPNYNTAFTPPSKARYMTFFTNGVYGTIYNHDICINISDPSKNGQYEPYDGHSYPLDPNLELRGLFKLDANNNLYAEGDIYPPSGEVSRRFSEPLDLGTLTWNYFNIEGHYRFVAYPQGIKDISSSVVGNMTCTRYVTDTSNNVYNNVANNTIGTAGGALLVYDSAYTDAQAFKTAMSGVYLVYELATPTTETAQPYASPQVVNPLGTEEYIDTRDIPVPVGHQTKYIKSNTGVVTDVMVNGEPVVNEKGVAEISALKPKVDFQEEDTTLYLSRPTYKGLGTGNRLDNEEIIGGTVAWNQTYLPHTNKYVMSGSLEGVTISFSNGIATISGTATADCSVAILPDAKDTPANHVCLLLKDGGNGIKWFRNGFSTSLTTKDYFIHKYSQEWSSDAVIRIENGVTYNTNVRFSAIDLTLAFGTEIADYVYSLEQASAGSGIAWLKSYGFFTKDYYPYDPGSTVSVKTSEHKTVGKNQFSGSVENGAFNGNGEDEPVTNRIRSEEFIRIIEQEQYCVSLISAKVDQVIVFYFADNNYTPFISGTGWQDLPFTNAPPKTAKYARFMFRASDNADITVSDVANVQLEFGSTATEYEPYESHSYPLDPNLELRGIPKLDNGSLYYDGDVYEPSGEVTRKYGIVDLGTLTWNYSMSYENPIFYTDINNMPPITPSGNIIIICSKYTTVGATSESGYANSAHDKTICKRSNAIRIMVQDSVYTDAQAFKTAMSGVYLVYELATPTIEQADPYAKSQVANPLGIEEYVDERDVPIPVEHKTYYYSSNERGVKDVFINKEPTTDRNGIATINALSLTGGTISGNLVVNGAISCPNNLQINTINGVTVGNNPKFTDTKVIKYTSSSFSSLPQTFTVSGCTTSMECIKAVLSVPSAQGSDWTVNTDTAGKVTLSGTFNGSTATTITLYLADIG